MCASERQHDPQQSEVLIIGAGQAGLAAAHELAKTGVDFQLVDASRVIGDSWRHRYDSLTLFTPRAISSLPGMTLPGDPDGYAGKDEFADYLASYAARGRFGVILETKVTALQKVGGTYTAKTSDGLVYKAAAVIIATGAFQKPRIPEIAGSFPKQVQQIHVADFLNASSVYRSPVLVVGDGASGRDVALALAPRRDVTLARGRPRKLLPERVFGRSTWKWLESFGLLGVSAQSIIRRRMRRLDPFPRRGNDEGTLSRLGIDVRPRLISVEGSSAIFADGTRMKPNSVVWSTGYVDDFGWVEIDAAFGPDRIVLQEAGISRVPGLYFLGRPWQRNRASALIAGAGEDAAFVVRHLNSWRRSLKRHRLRTESAVAA